MPTDTEEAQDEEYEPTPWHFKLLLVAFVLYLVYRLVQLIFWGGQQIL